MERTDDTGFGGIRVIQIKGQGYGVDAVLLASFAAGDTTITITATAISMILGIITNLLLKDAPEEKQKA